MDVLRDREFRSRSCAPQLSWACAMQEHLLDGQTSRRSTKNFALPPFRHVNHNVVLLILTRFFFGLADGIWNGTVVVNFLYQIGGDNEYLGTQRQQWAWQISSSLFPLVGLLIASAAPRSSSSAVCSCRSQSPSLYSALFAFHHQDEVQVVRPLRRVTVPLGRRSSHHEWARSGLVR